MDFLGGDLFHSSPHLYIISTAIAVFTLVGACLSTLLLKKRESAGNPSTLRSLWLFVYSCFLKPHDGDRNGTQQQALESFYSSQASIYDMTRTALLQGREDMLALAAAQVQYRVKQNGNASGSRRRVWVDIGGGTGWNIETMARFMAVSTFDRVYLVDFSPSLCEVARQRFVRLGWKNVKVLCQDARSFRLGEHEPTGLPTSQPGGAELVTMSYSLSMMPDYYSIVDSLPSLLVPQGIIGVVDFYVQSSVDVSFRNYTGGLINRHVNFLSRTFWRAWFDLDRVSLEPGRRDYLEYRFGTVLSVNSRNKYLGSIPYYIWLGTQQSHVASALPRGFRHHEGLHRQHTMKGRDALFDATVEGTLGSCTKTFDTAAQNKSMNLPLPSYFYQNHHHRDYYDDQLQKHAQFNDEYIYAFTWEDTREDERILKLKSDDVVLAITSAGDNILSYALQDPARIYAVDLNPAQNHLLELKIAAYASLHYSDFWALFGEGQHPDFRALLLSKLSPHLSSRALQYWLQRQHVFARTGGGLYDTGGSRHALRVVRWVTRAFGRGAVAALLRARTLNEQREVWRLRLRPALLSRLVARLVISQPAFLWAALGVPRHQLAMIEADHHAASTSPSQPGDDKKSARSRAVWQYMVDTLDPVAQSSHVASENPYYHVCLAGRYAPRCHPDYLAPAAHRRLSRPGAGLLEPGRLRIHTEELDAVLAALPPGELSVAVVMDSMDWFDAGAPASAALQAARLNRALRPGGRVLLRSAARRPWYLKEFERQGFAAKCMGERKEGRCIDRVNMYASCWLCVKKDNIPPPTPEMESLVGADVSRLVI
ncbi:hypothetical protein F4780DRAFT_785514 [Xylariomycetidae sp. FL0641]|nr:hypothetical protein F4780DRAFT_785514 [Xylariomycetidae sp. FL0641]